MIEGGAVDWTNRWVVTAFVAFVALVALFLSTEQRAAQLLVIDEGTSYAAIGAQSIALGGGLGLLVPPMTSMLLGSVEKAHSGVASGTLNSARQTGSVIGVALFGSLIGGSLGFVSGVHVALLIATVLLASACGATLIAFRRAPPRAATQRP